LKYNEKTKSPAAIINWRRKLSCYEFGFLELLATRIDFFYQLLIKWRKPVFLNEIKMANVSSKDKVLLIGCGILPSETIMIVEETNAKVVTIDNNIVAVKHAKSFIRRKGLANSITIERADGINYPVEDFDVIFIAINVWPIDLVLRHLSTQMKTNARVLCKGIKNDIIDVLEKKGLYDVFSVDLASQNPKTQSFLLTKK
jgi:ribosomal protein L11 methylase PrmA